MKLACAIQEADHAENYKLYLYKHPTDCASFVICDGQGITEALAFDQHYEQAGITALLRSGE